MPDYSPRFSTDSDFFGGGGSVLQSPDQRVGEWTLHTPPFHHSPIRKLFKMVFLDRLAVAARLYIDQGAVKHSPVYNSSAGI